MESVNTTYQSALSLSRDLYQRPNVTDAFAYDRFSITTDFSGTFTFPTNSPIDTYGYLYSPSFNATLPSLNLIENDDDSAGHQQFLIEQTLEAGQRYYLVITTYAPYGFGPFQLIINGPTSVNLTHIPRTFYLLVEMLLSKLAFIVLVPRGISYPFSLTINHPTFILPFVRTGAHYYDLFAVTVSEINNYTLGSASTIASYGFLYFPSFNASAPFLNSVASSSHLLFYFRTEVSK